MPYVIAVATPSAFILDVDFGPTSKAVTFNIPRHVYTAGYWEVTGQADHNYNVFHALSTPTFGASTIKPQTNVPYDDLPFPPAVTNLALSGAQLTEVNAAAGGVLSATFGYSGGALPVGGIDTITYLALYLLYAGGDEVRGTNTLWVPSAANNMVGGSGRAW